MELVMHKDSSKHSTSSLSILLQGLMRKGQQNGSIKASTIVCLWVQAGNPAETAPIPYEMIAQERARDHNGIRLKPHSNELLWNKLRVALCSG